MRQISYLMHANVVLKYGVGSKLLFTLTARIPRKIKYQTQYQDKKRNKIYSENSFLKLCKYISYRRYGTRTSVKLNDQPFFSCM
jgi:hypothetical protein